MVSSPTPSRNASRANQNGKGEDHQPHPNEPNAWRALQTLVIDRRLPLNVDELLGYAYRFGADGDPWDGYLVVKSITEFQLDSAKNPASALRARLNSREVTA
jgi:hypothetical protein